jgi:hypothetical protein
MKSTKYERINFLSLWDKYSPQHYILKYIQYIFEVTCLISSH